MSNKLNQILDETDRLEQLDFDSLKELWVKNFLWKGYRKRLMSKPGNPLMSDEYETNLKLLKDYEANYGIGRFILDNNAFRQSVKKVVLDNNDNVVNALFDKYSKDLPESTIKEMIVKQLKGTLNGSCGMPIHKILRGTIENCLVRQELDNS